MLPHAVNSTPLHVVPPASPSLCPLRKCLFFLQKAPLLRRLPQPTLLPLQWMSLKQTKNGLHSLFWVSVLAPARLGPCNHQAESVAVHLPNCQHPQDYEGSTGRGSSLQGPYSPSTDRWWLGPWEPITHIPWGHFRLVPALESEIPSVKWSQIELEISQLWHKYQRNL